METKMSRILVCLMFGLLASGAVLAADSAVPPFAFMNGGWQAAGVVFLPPESGPGPVVDMPDVPASATISRSVSPLSRWPI
jgi:hypothetical protein